MIGRSYWNFIILSYPTLSPSENLWVALNIQYFFPVYCEHLIWATNFFHSDHWNSLLKDLFFLPCSLIDYFQSSRRMIPLKCKSVVIIPSLKTSHKIQHDLVPIVSESPLILVTPLRHTDYLLSLRLAMNLLLTGSSWNVLLERHLF
jgi:hypothetical protein